MIENPDRQVVVIPEHFKGIALDDNNKEQETPLTLSWMQDNYSLKYIEGIKAYSRGGEFVRIPPGSCRERVKMADATMPPIVYQQKKTTGCLFLSLANAIHYLGFIPISQVLAGMAKDHGKDDPGK